VVGGNRLEAGRLFAVTAVRLEWKGREREVRLEKDGALVDGERMSFREVRREGRLVALEISDGVFPVRVARRGDRAFVGCAGAVFELRRIADGALRRRSAGAGESHAGLIRRGDRVTKGQVVLILEAMKMEHAIRAPQDGVVTRLEHGEGDLVEAGAVLADIG
jgi:propionyl-CoA carboxylase alpha chain